MQISTLGQSLCNGVPMSQHNIETHGECPAYFSPRQHFLSYLYTPSVISLSGGQAPIKIPIIIINRYRVPEASAHNGNTCVQISPVWFASVRSEEVVIKKGNFLFMVIMETLKCTCVPSFNSMGCMV